jgi:hypothetical protein
LQKLKDGMEAVKTGMELFKGLMDLLGGAKGVAGMTGMAGCGNMMGWNTGYDMSGGGYTPSW